MRSRKVEPAAAVTRTLIPSDSTIVPPVTAERSPPDSRITGADSPVMADSLTEAMPSITSPSDGMRSPGSTSTTSPTLRSSALTSSVTPSRCLWSTTRLARVSLRVLRMASACALPRPSATASAKLANSTVNQSQAAIWPENRAPPLPAARSRRNRTVTTRDTASVTKMTGFLASVRGSSLWNAAMAARLALAGSNRLVAEREAMGGGSE